MCTQRLRSDAMTDANAGSPETFTLRGCGYARAAPLGRGSGPWSQWRADAVGRRGDAAWPPAAIAVRALPAAAASGAQRAELERLGAIDHANVARFYGEIAVEGSRAEASGRAILATELIPGCANLKDWLTPLDEASLSEVFTQACAAVWQCHSANVAVHNLSAASFVWCIASRLVKLVKLGPAGGSSSADAIAYRPPELGNPESSSAGRHVDATKADIWSLGALLYFMACRECPFGTVAGRDGEEASVILERISRSEYKTPSLLQKKCPEALRDLIEHMLTPEPNQRLGLRDVMAHRWIVNFPLPTTGSGVPKGAAPWLAVSKTDSSQF
jgi:serine/threonine protein kinase